MLSKYVITCYYIINNNCSWQMIIVHPKDESMELGLDGRIKLAFHGIKVTSNSGLLA